MFGGVVSTRRPRRAQPIGLHAAYFFRSLSSVSLSIAIAPIAPILKCAPAKTACNEHAGKWSAQLSYLG
jgi:hypothetical protein